MKKVVITDFSGLRDAELDKQGHTVDKAMTSNTHFPLLTNEVSAVRTAAEAYSAALAVLATGGPDAKSIKDTARKVLLKALRVLGIHVNLTADGDETMLRTSGFPLADDHSRYGQLPKAEGLSVTAEPGHGNMRLKVDKIDGAHGYLFQYTKTPVTPDSVWTNCFSSKTICHITGLESRVEYAFRVAGAGTDPALLFSDVISSNVL